MKDITVPSFTTGAHVSIYRTRSLNPEVSPQLDGFVPISIDNNNVSAPTFQSKPALCPQKTEKTSGKCTDNSEISLELPNGIKMKFKGTGGCKAALSLLTKLCGTCFA